MPAWLLENDLRIAVDMGQSASLAIVVHSRSPTLWEIVAMTNRFRTALFVSTALALGASNPPANAQPYGPGPGGMMGWGMGWDMGGFGGICLLVGALLIVGFAFLALRRRNS